jgi:hypothetical protein
MDYVIPVKILIPALALAGLLLLLFGWYVYRIAMTAAMVVMGGIGGMWLAQHWGWPPLPVALIAGLICGILSGAVEKLGAFLLGGSTGVALVYSVRELFQHLHNQYVAEIIAFLVLGALTVIFFRPLVTFIFAALGAICIVHSALIYAESSNPGLGRRIITDYPSAIITIFFILLITGILFQMRGKPAEKPKPRRE